MNTLDAIVGPRSIRFFKPDPVPTGLLETILSAATLAPSAMNRQPWRFVVFPSEKRAEVVGIMCERITRSRARG